MALILEVGVHSGVHREAGVKNDTGQGPVRGMRPSSCGGRSWLHSFPAAADCVWAGPEGS